MSESLSNVGSKLEDRDQRRVVEQIDTWRKQLINLARSNRLLYFRHTRMSTLEIVRGPGELVELAGRLLAGGSWRFYEPPEPDADEHTCAPDSRDREVNADELVTSKTTARDLGNALRALDRRATQEFMDKGIWILYLAAGMLHWTDPDTDEQAESPLVMIPVQLFRENPREPFELRRADEDVVLNPALGSNSQSSESSFL